MFKKYVLQHKKRQQQVFVTIRVYRKTVFDIFFYICDMEILFWIFTILLIVALSALLIVPKTPQTALLYGIGLRQCCTLSPDSG